MSHHPARHAPNDRACALTTGLAPYRDHGFGTSSLMLCRPIATASKCASARSAWSRLEKREPSTDESVDTSRPHDSPTAHDWADIDGRAHGAMCGRPVVAVLVFMQNEAHRRTDAHGLVQQTPVPGSNAECASARVRRSARWDYGGCASRAEPFDDVLLASGLAGRCVEGGSVGVIGCPVEVGPGVEQAFRSAALPRGAGVPERLGDLLLIGVGGEKRVDAVKLAERGCVPQLVDRSTTGHEESGYMPAAVADGVVQWCADGPIGCLKISAAIEQSRRDVCVVAACRPM